MSLNSVMLIAGEASGDLLAAELVRELAAGSFPFRPRFFGVGGPKMAAAGVELAIDLTQHSVIGLIEVVKRYSWFKQIFKQVLDLALERRPDVIVCVDYGGFNRRFAAAVRKAVASQSGEFRNWKPRIVQYVSPQVWASRPGRAYSMARDLDLLLTIFPFEKAWYAQRVPGLKVEFVGHPIIDRYASRAPHASPDDSKPLIVLLPGSRAGEMTRHLPPILGAVEIIRKEIPAARFKMVLPNERLIEGFTVPAGVEVQIGRLADALEEASAAIASTGTVTLECAYFGVPTVAMYKTSWSTYQIGRRIIQVKYLAMPNILADAIVFPEFIQDEATPEKIGNGIVILLRSPDLIHRVIKTMLRRIIHGLGDPGAARRAAASIMALDTP